MAQQNPSPGISETFEAFFNDRLSSKQILLDQLLLAIEPQNSHKIDQHENLIDLVLTHYREYCEEKSKAANEDVSLFLSLEWFTSFERTLIWQGEFKPSVIFRLINGSVKDLTEERSARIEMVKFETRRQERELAETMARIQESLAAPPILNLVRRVGRLVDVEVSEMEEAMEVMKTAMHAILGECDGGFKSIPECCVFGGSDWVSIESAEVGPTGGRAF